jgi:hypothetical protein
LDDPRIKRPTIDLLEATSFVASNDPATKLSQADNAAYFPKKKISFKINKEEVIRNKVVRPEDYDKIVDTMYIDLSDRDYLAKDEYMILDLLANNHWERPIYFAITIGPNKFLNLEKYFQLEGFAYRLVPIRNDKEGDDRINFGRVASDIMYNNLFNNFKWGNMNNPKVYIDENNSRMMTNIRNNFNRLAGTLVEENKKDQAVTVLEKGFALVPPSVVDYEYFSLEMLSTFYETGAKEKASKVAEGAYKSFNEILAYMVSLPPDYRASGDVNEEIQRTMFYLQKLGSICNSFGDKALAEKSEKTLQEYLGRYQVK